MKDILIRHGNYFMECELDGLKMDYTYSDDPKFHTVVFLKNSRSYEKLKKELQEIYDSYSNTIDGFNAACEFLETVDCSRVYFTGSNEYCYRDLRSRDEIGDYLNEATDKVCLMRSRPSRRTDIETDRILNVARILRTYDDIPKEGYTDWDCGYWNGIMGALCWVLGEEKDWLDT